MLSKVIFRLLNFCFRAWGKENEVIFNRLQKLSFISSLEGASFERRTCAFGLENRLLKTTKVRNQILSGFSLLRFGPFQKGKGIPSFAWKHHKSCFQGEVLGYALVSIQNAFCLRILAWSSTVIILKLWEKNSAYNLNFRWGFMNDKKKNSWSALLKDKVNSWVLQMMIKSSLSLLFLLTIVKMRW